MRARPVQIAGGEAEFLRPWYLIPILTNKAISIGYFDGNEASRRTVER
jgi:hypothetical protein